MLPGAEAAGPTVGLEPGLPLLPQTLNTPPVSGKRAKRLNRLKWYTHDHHVLIKLDTILVLPIIELLV